MHVCVHAHVCESVSERVCVCVCEPGYGTLGDGGCCGEVTDGSVCVVAQRRRWFWSQGPASPPCPLLDEGTQRVHRAPSNPWAKSWHQTWRQRSCSTRSLARNGICLARRPVSSAPVCELCVSGGAWLGPGAQGRAEHWLRSITGLGCSVFKLTKLPFQVVFLLNSPNSQTYRRVAQMHFKKQLLL